MSNDSIIVCGCRVEDRQLETVEQLIRCLMVDVIIAWRILLLTKLGRKGDGQPGSVTIWRGLTRLHGIVEAWLILPTLHDSPRCG